MRCGVDTIIFPFDCGYLSFSSYQSKSVVPIGVVFVCNRYDEYVSWILNCTRYVQEIVTVFPLFERKPK